MRSEIVELAPLVGKSAIAHNESGPEVVAASALVSRAVTEVMAGSAPTSMKWHARSDRPDVATQFTAMASPCLVLVDTADQALGAEVGQIVKTEAARIEQKFSRYRPSAVTHINKNAGRIVAVDQETADLIDYSVFCYMLSEKRFDITSGVLRRVWKFDRTATIPTHAEVRKILKLVGWHRVTWSRPELRLAAGMQIDFGGIGKEYAVDRALALATARSPAPVLVNLGGDLRVSGRRRDGSPWRVAIEDVDRSGVDAGLIELSSGALATSGDAHRFLMRDGVRYAHVLDPTTGWPIAGAPRSVTVHAPTCSEAGLLAKLALLRGSAAEQFLKSEEVRAWCVR